MLQFLFICRSDIPQFMILLYASNDITLYKLFQFLRTFRHMFIMYPIPQFQQMKRYQNHHLPIIDLLHRNIRQLNHRNLVLINILSFIKL